MISKRLKFLYSSQRGLTLVEILVVLIILGIVMTFLGSRILGAGDQAKASLTQTKIKDIQGRIELFRTRYNSLPSSLEELTRCSEKTGPGCVPMANEDELTDAWNGRLQYSLDNGGRTYRIKSLGSDGKDGGDGVNYDITVTGP